MGNTAAIAVAGDGRNGSGSVRVAYRCNGGQANRLPHWPQLWQQASCT